MVHGVEEQGLAFDRTSDLVGLGRFRRFGSQGPLYEILDASQFRLRIRVVESGEELGYDADAARLDPLG